jgi:hypothetical protein
MYPLKTSIQQAWALALEKERANQVASKQGDSPNSHEENTRDNEEFDRIDRGSNTGQNIRAKI